MIFLFFLFFLRFLVNIIYKLLFRITAVNSALSNQYIYDTSQDITTIGSLSAGQSDFGSVQFTVPNGYKTTGICSVNKGHPGLGYGFYIYAGLSKNLTGEITIYYSYGAVASVPANATDFTITLEYVKI